MDIFVPRNIICLFLIFQLVQNSIQEPNDILHNKNNSVKVNCKCPSIYAPVCGSDGETYHNRCFLSCFAKHRLQYSECENLTVVKLDACDTLETHRFKRHDACNCSRLSDPVCGSDNITYYNSCFLNCAIQYERLKYETSDLRIKYFGKCH